MRCPECQTETEEFNGGQRCPECAVFVVPPSPVDARALSTFQDTASPYAQDILSITNSEFRDVLLSLIYYYAEYKYSVGQSGYVPARLLGKDAFLNSIRWMEAAPSITDAAIEVFRLFVYYASERESKYVEVAIRCAASALHLTRSPVLQNLETNLA
jgi:hypothetical protein